MKPMFLAVIPFIYVSISSASELSCNQELTREPYCISIENAEAYCNNMGKDPAVLLKTKECHLKFSKMMSSDQATSMCLAAFIKSSDETKNKSNCGQSTGNKKQPGSGGIN